VHRIGADPVQQHDRRCVARPGRHVAPAVAEIFLARAIGDRREREVGQRRRLGSHRAMLVRANDAGK